MTHRSHHRDPLEEVLIEEGRLPAPRRAFRLQDIEPGWTVIDNREVELGSVESVEDGFLAVHRRRFAPRLYVPVSAVGAVREGIVELNVPASWIPTLDWTRPPRHPDGR